MFIPKNRMMVITAVIDAGLSAIGKVLSDEEREVVNQIADKAALVANGDANFLEVDTVYATNPGRSGSCRYCGGKGKGDCPEC